MKIDSILNLDFLVQQIDEIVDVYKPRMPIVEWLEQYRYIPPVQSKEYAGQFNKNLIPYLNEILHELSPDSAATHVALQKSVQSAATVTAAEGAMAYYIGHQLGSVMYLTSSRNIAKIRSSASIDILIDNTYGLAARLKPISSRMKRKTADTTYYKEFSGGIQLLMTSYQSIGDLKSNSFVLIICDEWAEAPFEVVGQGDMAGIIEGRTLAASQFKMFFLSTPSSVGSCQINRSFLFGDQREWFVPCPECGEFQILSFKKRTQDYGLTFETEIIKNRKVIVKNSIKYICKYCKKYFYESHKKQIMAQGEWRPCWQDTPPKNDKHVSFHVSGLMSPFLSWERICDEFVKINFGKDILSLKNFRINLLGEAWENITQKLDWEDFQTRAKDYSMGSVPGAGDDGGLILFGGVDVQQDRLELAIVAYGEEMEIWLVEYETFYFTNGGQQDFRVGAWQALADYCYEYKNEVIGRLSLVAIDVGYNPHDNEKRAKDWGQKNSIVKEFVNIYHDLFIAVKGIGDKQSEILKRNKEKVFTINTSNFKHYLYDNLKLESGPRAINFPKYRTIEGVQIPMDDFIYQSFCSEQYKEDKTGKSKWIKIFDRNEILDMIIYSLACAYYYGVHRYGEQEWDFLRSSAKNVS